MTATLLGQPLDTIKTLMQSLGWTFSVFGDDLWEGVIELLMTPFNQISWKWWKGWKTSCMTYVMYVFKCWYASKTCTRQCSNHSKLHEAVPGTLDFMNPTSISVCPTASVSPCIPRSYIHRCVFCCSRQFASDELFAQFLQVQLLLNHQHP